MPSYVPPFPNLTFKTVVTAALSFEHCNDSESLRSHIVAAFAVASTSFYNSSLQAHVVSRMRIDAKNMKFIELFLHPPTTAATTTTNNLSTIQMTPVLNMRNLRGPQTLLNKLKNSTYFSRSLKHLTVQQYAPDSLFRALDNLVALEVLDLRFFDSVSAKKGQELSVIARLPLLIELKLGFNDISADECGFFDFLGHLENNKGFRKLKVEFFRESAHQDLKGNLARLFARNLLTHLALNYYFTDDDLDVLIDAKLTKLQSLQVIGKAAASPSKIADAIIASSSSLTTVEVDRVSDSELIKCAEYLTNIVELRIYSPSVNGSFLREKGSCFASNLEILDMWGSHLADGELGDGFKYLTSLRKLDLSWNQNFDGASSLQHLAAATSLEEWKLGTLTRESLEPIGQLTQLRWLHAGEVADDITREEVTRLKSLVNLRKLTLACSNAELYQGILSVAASFPLLTHASLGMAKYRGLSSARYSRDEVAHLLEKCWPLVRYAQMEIDDARAVMPYLRRRFPHVSFGYENERLVPFVRGHQLLEHISSY